MPSIKQIPQPAFEKELKKANTEAKQAEVAKKTDTANTGEPKVCEAEQACFSPNEKLALSAAAGAVGGAAAAICLVDDSVLEKAKKLGKQAGEAIKERYKHPPEEKLIDSVKQGLRDAGDAIEEFVDDVKDGRVARDVSKATSRFVRDHFTEQSPSEKFKNKVKDTLEDTKDLVADAIDDVQDGRERKKLAKFIENK